MSIAYSEPNLRVIRDEEAPAYDGQHQRRPGPFTMIPESVRNLNDGYAVAVYEAIARYANQDGDAWPSIATICEITGWSKNHVLKTIKKLIESGIITREQRQRNGMHISTIYRITANVRMFTARTTMFTTETSVVHTENNRCSPHEHELYPVELESIERDIPPFVPPVGGAPKEPKPKVVQATRIPDDFAVDDGLIRWAEAKGFKPDELAHHTERFKNYWGSEGGAKARKVDWRRAWQTWVSRETPGRWPGAPKVQFGSASPKPNGTRLDTTPMTQESFDLDMAHFRERQYREGDMRCGPRPEGGWLAEHYRKYGKAQEPAPGSYNGWEPTPIRQGV